MATHPDRNLTVVLQRRGLRLCCFQRNDHVELSGQGLKHRAQLRHLNDAASPQDMNIPGWRLHPLKGGELSAHWSIWVSGNWRLTFRFKGEHVILVDYQDYH